MAIKRVAIPFKELALRIVGPAHTLLASRVQRFEVNSNFPSTDIDELGNLNHAGVTTGTPEITATFQAMDVSPKIFAVLTGNLVSYPAAGVSISSLTDIDLVGEVKDDTASDFVKTVHARKLRISGFTYTYSVDSESTEEYTAIGAEKRWFKNDVIIDRFAASGTGPYTLSQTPIQLKNNNYLLSVISDGVYQQENAIADEATEYSYAGGDITLGAAASDQVLAVYHASPAGTNWEYVSDPTIPAAIRGQYVPVTIGVNSIDRVQSVTIRGTFPTQKVEEMGSTSLVGYTTQVPQVAGDITVLDTDIELISLLTTGDTPSADTEFRACEYTASGLSLQIELKDPIAGCDISAATVLKTVYIAEITITSEGHSTGVGSNAQQTFGFKSTDGSLTVYSGARP